MVGNDEKVRIYKDKWLLGPIPNVLFSRMMNDNAMVAALINQDEAWNGYLVKRCFDDRETTLILSISLCGNRFIDRLV